MPPPVQVSKLAAMAKAGAQMKISINAVGSVINERSRHIDELEELEEFATIAMHISQRTRGTRAFTKE